MLDATDLIVGETGVERATSAAIATRAGVSPGTLFHYFPNKTALLAAWEERVVARAAGIVLGELLAFGAHAPTDYGVRRLVHLGCALIQEHLAFCRAPIGSLFDLARSNERLAIIRRGAELLASGISATPLAHLLRPKDLPLAMEIILKTTIAMGYAGATEHAADMASGAFQDELASLVSRYLLGDAGDTTGRDVRDPTANLPRLRPSP